jgi:hypothetical protein
MYDGTHQFGFSSSFLCGFVCTITAFCKNQEEISRRSIPTRKMAFLQTFSCKISWDVFVQWEVSKPFLTA